MAQRTVTYSFYDGKQVIPSASKVDSINQTVASRGVQHQCGGLSIVQDVLGAGTYSDRVSVYTQGDLALVIYMTTGQFTAFETSVIPALSVLGIVAPSAFNFY